MKNGSLSRKLLLSNLRLAESNWGGKLNGPGLAHLKTLSSDFKFSVADGDLLLLNAKWYVTHVGLIRLATRRRCGGIEVQPIPEFCDALTRRYVFKATVHKRHKVSQFVGYGDADPSNVSHLVKGAEMRVAETRAVNRALRKAYGIGICSVEEIGCSTEHTTMSEMREERPRPPANGNGHVGSVRDRLYQLIRQHRLDPNLVKSYATEFCGVKELREAAREQVETFVVHLADWADKDRPGLLCQLNAYLGPKGNDGKEGAA